MATFTRMVCTVARPRRTANGSLDKSSDISATSAVSSATSVPAAPMAMPTSAVASAGASLMPSPTIATVPCSRCSICTSVTLSAGIRSAYTSSTPDALRIISADRRVSPVSSTTCSTPASRSDCTTEVLPARGWSASPITPSAAPSRPMNTGVLPLASISAMRA